MKLLIAEDNLILQKSLCILLKSWGIEFDVANNGQEAIEKAAANEDEYDLCLMDIDMPVMNGCDAAKVLRRDFKYFPIMAMSGKAVPVASSGFDDYIKKPYTPELLLEKINELTVKSLKISLKKSGIHFKKETPEDAAQLEELRELAKKDLSLLVVESDKGRYTLHQNIKSKMNQILVGEDKEHFVLIAGGEAPAEYDLSNVRVTRVSLTPEQFEALLKEEDGDIENYSCKVDQKF